jgi:hypothetical protein
MANFYRKLFGKVKQMKQGVKFIQEYFPVGAKQIGRKIKYHLAGGAYGKQMERRYQRTPEGKKIMKSLETKGFWKTLKEIRKRYRK